MLGVRNTNLPATNINLNTIQDTKIKGANLQATNQLNLNTKNLEVSSVQKLFALFELTALFALAWRFEPTMVVVLLVLMLMLLATRLEAIDWVCWAWSWR
jgi:hypothetical protein